MPITVLEMNDQPGLPNEKVQTAWYLRLNSVHAATDRDVALRVYHNAIGYTQALRDAELITNEIELAMTATLAQVWRKAQDRLEVSTAAKNA